MNVRIKKEFQGLFWPWLAAALIGLLPILSWMLPTTQFEQIFHSVYLLSGTGFILGIALLTTMPFGEEFSLQTMPALLSHPVTRGQIWREKLRITLLLTLSVALIHTVSLLPFIGLHEEQLKLSLAFLLFTVCSGTFWALLTRSTIGGLVLCLFTQALLLVVAQAFTQQDYFSIGAWRINTGSENWLMLASLFLSPIFLWSGWRLFSRMQTAIDWDHAALNLVANTAAKSSLTCLRKDSPFRNLIIKELRLLKPAFVSILLFGCLWLVIAMLKHQLPARKDMLENILGATSMLYTVWILMLAGSLSVGEEKNLGMHQANLTLPVSPVKQWLLKYFLAITVGLLSSMLIPMLLAKMEMVFTNHHSSINYSQFLDERNRGYAYSFGILMILIASLCFWASTLTNRTIQAAFLSAFALVLITSTRALGVQTGESMTWLADQPILWLTAHYQLPLGWYDSSFEARGFLLALPFLLYSSLKHFRGLHCAPRTAFTHSAIILTIVFFFGLSIGYLKRFTDMEHLHNSYLAKETKAAILAISYRLEDIHHGEDLALTRKLSPVTVLWLKGSEIRVTSQNFSTELQTLSPSKYAPYISVEIWLQSGYKVYLYINPLGERTHRSTTSKSKGSL